MNKLNEKYAGAEKHFKYAPRKKCSAHLRRLASTIRMYCYVFFLQYFIDNANNIGFCLMRSYSIAISKILFRWSCIYWNSMSLALSLLSDNMAEGIFSELVENKSKKKMLKKVEGGRLR